MVPGWALVLVMIMELQMGQVIRTGLDPNCGIEKLFWTMIVDGCRAKNGSPNLCHWVQGSRMTSYLEPQYNHRT